MHLKPGLVCRVQTFALKVFKTLAHAATAAHTTHEGVMKNRFNTRTSAGYAATDFFVLNFCFHYFVFNLFASVFHQSRSWHLFSNPDPD
jgi:hypothetical protein